jgi:hypothetical protein
MIILIIQSHDSLGAHSVRDLIQMHDYNLDIYIPIWAIYYGGIEYSRFYMNKTKHFYL